MPLILPTSQVGENVDPILLEAIERACGAIAPSWPLDRAIAVNPMLGHVAMPFEHAAGELAAVHGARALPPRALLRELWRDGQLRREHLEAAIVADDADRGAELASPIPARQRAEALLEALREDPPAPLRLPLVTDLADAARRRNEPLPWSQLVVEQVGRHAAIWFDRGQASWSPDRRPGLFAAWCTGTAQDPSWPSRRVHAAFARQLDAVPRSPLQAIAWALDRLELHADSPGLDGYLAALLGTVRGWASWCAYERWQARLAGGDDEQLHELLAVRLVWEVLLAEDLALQAELETLRRGLAQRDELVDRARARQRDDQLLLRALELVFQQRLRAGLRAPQPQRLDVAVEVAAVFCIDVRSERLRRALERASDGRATTHGFAGFFGLPLGVSPFGAAEQRPHLPGLLAPTQSSGEQLADAAASAALQHTRQQRLAWRQRWARFKKAPASAFSFVESCGLLSLGRLVREAWSSGAPTRSEHAALRRGERSALRPCWHDAAARDVDLRADLAASALRGMGLVRDLPRVVLLVGHGSSSHNNAHAAALDCGACGGHSGEHSARLLAVTLEDQAVRDALAARGIAIPEHTRFVAGLHDTTTDEVQLFVDDLERELPNGTLRRLREWFDAAGAATRSERAPGLGLAPLRAEPARLLDELRRRAADWSEVRPEYGLADNAALVLAPRERTAHLDLGGRVFLHDYRAEQDPDRGVLTQLLTAPMVVANWINLQYFASVVDPTTFGSGNKLLHNVVGGRLGVLEGNGGDLRIGLPLQSVHDGTRWRHTPVRLSVFVEADAAAIDDVLANHEAPRQLVDNGWLHLFRIAPDGRTWRRLRGGNWHEDELPSTPPAPLEQPAEPPAATRDHGALLAIAAVGVGVLLRALWGA
ncbi:MAG: DUF2309 domain-containing protein [Planctomycetota bacterium]